MEARKILLIGGAVIVGGIGVMLFRQHEAQIAAQSSDSNATDAELAALMMQSPLSYAAQSAPVSAAPTVDTGNAQLQQLLNSILSGNTPGYTSPVPPLPTPTPAQTPTPIMSNPTGTSTGNTVTPTNAPPVYTGPVATPARTLPIMRTVLGSL